MADAKRKAAQKAAGELLKAAIAEAGLGKAEFARLIKRHPHNIYRWCAGKEFDADNRREAALGLGKAQDYFDQPDEQEKRDAETARVLKDFMRRPIAKRLSPAQLAVIRSMRWVDAEVRPYLAFYEAMALELLGDIPASMTIRVAETNDAIDRTSDLSTRPRRRKTPPK